MTEAFPLYERWGVAGVKIDFMSRDDQYVTNWYYRTAELAAKHHLMLDFHGATQTHRHGAHLAQHHGLRSRPGHGTK